MLAVAAALGLVFLSSRRANTADIAAGFGLDSGGFFTLYYLITGFHALHVVFGLVVLASSPRGRASMSRPARPSGTWSISSGCWSFPILYLVR
jgi:nitric oxide reductase NorE protein